MQVQLQVELNKTSIANESKRIDHSNAVRESIFFSESILLINFKFRHKSTSSLVNLQL